MYAPGRAFLLTAVLVLSFAVVPSTAVTGSDARVYVSSFTPNNTVAVIDVATNQVLTTIPGFGAGPLDVAVSPSGSQVFVSDDADSSVSVVSTTTNSVIATIPVGNTPAGLKVTPDGNRLYVAAGGGVSVIDAHTFSAITTIATGGSPNGVDVAPSGAFAYVATTGLSSVTVIDTSSNSVVASIPTSSFPTRVAVSPDGQTLYALIRSSNPSSIACIDVPTLTVTKYISLGAQALHIALSPDGRNLYATVGNTIAVVNTASKAITQVFPLSALFIAVTPDNAVLFATQPSSSSLLKINASTGTVLSTISVPAAESAIVPAPSTSSTITQPLSPTALNTFNFGTHVFKNQYPPGTSFSGINMRVTATTTSSAAFHQRLIGTTFANASCIVYGGAGENCVVYSASCFDSGGNPITCPTSSNISVFTSYDTRQAVINPGFLHAPHNTNQWQDILTEFFLQRIDPTTKGKTTGFSDFVAVDLGTASSSSVGQFKGFLFPLNQSGSGDSHTIPQGQPLPIRFRVFSFATGKALTNVHAKLAVQHGSQIMPVELANHDGISPNIFQYSAAPGELWYQFDLRTGEYPLGTYTITVFSDSFPAQQVQFKVVSP